MTAEGTCVHNNVCLVVIDGWGISPQVDTTGDAVRNAHTPVMDRLATETPYTTLEAHGLGVGLPDGLMGNSEVGHLNIGAGRIVYQVRGSFCVEPSGLLPFSPEMILVNLGHCPHRPGVPGEVPPR